MCLKLALFGQFFFPLASRPEKSLFVAVRRFVSASALLLPRLGSAAHRQRHWRKFFAPSNADRALAEAVE
jgi:hypothetical protein